MHRNEWKWKHNNQNPMGHCKSSAKGKVHSITGSPQETRKKSVTVFCCCCCCCSVAKSCQTLCNPMDCSTPGFPVLHSLPGVCSNLCPLSQGCHPTTSPSVAPFSCPQSFPASRSFPMSWPFMARSASVVPISNQGWFPLGLTGLISWLSGGSQGSSPAPQF